MKKLLICFSLFILSSSFSFCQSWCWGKAGKGGALNLVSSPVATNRLGNVYITGAFENNLTIGSDTLTNSRSNVFIAKYDSHGSFLWATNSSDWYGGGSYGQAILTDNQDNAYITGILINPDFINADTIVFGPDTFSFMGYSTFLVKYSPAGQVLWAKVIPNFSEGCGLAFDKRGNICVATIDTLFKFTPTGSMLIHKYVNDNYSINAITTDSLNNMYLTGYIMNVLSLESYIPFIAKYDSNGNQLWAQAATLPSASSSGNGYSVITDRATNVYVTGSFRDTITWGKNSIITLPSHHSLDSTYALFLAKFSSNGRLLWLKQTKGTSLWSGTSLANDRYDNIYLGGYGNDDDTLSIGGDILTLSSLSSASFFIQLDTSGNMVSGSLLKNGNSGFPYDIPLSPTNGIAVDSDGKYCFLTGTFNGYADTIICGNDTLSIGNSYTSKWSKNECSFSAGVSAVSYQASSILLYPNPGNGVFTFQSSVVSGKSSVEVYNVLGEKVYSNSYQPTANGYQLNLSNQPNGIYLYRVISETGGMIGEGKLVKQ